MSTSESEIRGALDELLGLVEGNHMIEYATVDRMKALLAAQPAASAEPAAWLHEDGSNRVVNAATKAHAMEIPGASQSSLRGYSIPLYAHPPAPQWLPIESAPKDGTTIMACDTNNYIPQAVVWATYHPNATGIACWRTGRIGGNKLGGLTHWQPLPAAPGKEG